MWIAEYVDMYMYENTHLPGCNWSSEKTHATEWCVNMHIYVSLFVWILEYLTHCPAYFTMAHWGMLLSENTKVPMRSDVSPTLVFRSIISQALACSLKQKFSFQDLTLHSLVWTILTFETISFILLCRLKWHIGAWQIKFYVSSQPSLRRSSCYWKKVFQ